MVLGMADSPLGPASLDAPFLMVPRAFHRDSPAFPSLLYSSDA